VSPVKEEGDGDDEVPPSPYKGVDVVTVKSSNPKLNRQIRRVAGMLFAIIVILSRLLFAECLSLSMSFVAPADGAARVSTPDKEGRARSSTDDKNRAAGTSRTFPSLAFLLVSLLRFHHHHVNDAFYSVVVNAFFFSVTVNANMFLW